MPQTREAMVSSHRMNPPAFCALLRRSALCLTTAWLAAPGSHGASATADWPAWRGPTRDGIAAKSAALPPVKWSATENIVWKAPLPGRGHGSPTVVGQRIYLATADTEQQNQRVLCFDRTDGHTVWDTVVHRGGLDQAGHRNTSQASSTVAFDGDRLFIHFLNNKAIHTTALDLDGRILWQQTVGDFVTHQGFASSPVVHGSVVLATADHKGGGTIAGLDRATGSILWKQSRPKIANYTSPSVLQLAGKTQMVVAGCNLVSSFNPVSGEKLWEIAGSTEECVVTAVTDGTRVFVSGGYPKNHTMAVMGDGSGTIAWQNNARVYVPSMIVEDGHVYAVLDAGMAVCWKSDTGEERWKERLGGDFYASPVRIGQRMYAINQAAVLSVYEATPERFQLLAQNKLEDEAFASPAICGGRLYLRVAKTGETRQEFLYCIGSDGPKG